MLAHRPQLLISVRSAEEAAIAVEHGADIIDIKEPARGPLGMADHRTIEQIVVAVNRRCPVSVALGELADAPSPLRLPVGVTFAKVGLGRAPRRWRSALAARFADAPQLRSVAVAYAAMDRAEASQLAVGEPDDVLQWAIDHGASALLIDTCCKDGRTIFDSMAARTGALRRLVDRARLHSLPVALAGSLTLALVSRAIETGADIVAVRGAACAESNRQAAVDGQRVRELANLIAGRSVRQRHPSPGIHAEG